jgi:hypothetical protein
MKCNLLAVSIAISLWAVTAFAGDVATPHLKAGVGYGANYGAGTGFNNELVLNDHVSAQVGAGYLDHIGWGAVTGLSIYPAGNNNRYFSPRLSVLYGRVGRVDLDEGVKGHRYEGVNGFAVGVGGQFPLCTSKKLTGNVDVYYTDPNLPDGFTLNDSARYKFSLGVAYAFGG